MLHRLAKRFIAGDSLDSAAKPISNLIDDGYQVSIDYVGEDSKTEEECVTAFKEYLKITNRYDGQNIDISIKLSQLGLSIHPVVCMPLIDRIAQRAKEHNHTIRLDMEDSDVTTCTRNFAIVMNRKYGNVGVAIQANLSRSDEDIEHLIKNNVSIRLVKGAYKGDLTRATVPARFSSLAYHLKFQKANKPAIATHDEQILKKIDDKFYEYEFLYGIRRDLQKRLKKSGHVVRIYVPYGKKWLPYTVRRLKEWKNLKFITFNVIREWFK